MKNVLKMNLNNQVKQIQFLMSNYLKNKNIVFYNFFYFFQSIPTKFTALYSPFFLKNSSICSFDKVIFLSTIPISLFRYKQTFQIPKSSKRENDFLLIKILFPFVACISSDVLAYKAYIVLITWIKSNE